MKLSPKEKELIEVIREESKPFTRIEIKYGANGRSDSWIVHTSRKVVVGD